MIYPKTPEERLEFGIRRSTEIAGIMRRVGREISPFLGMWGRVRNRLDYLAFAAVLRGLGYFAAVSNPSGFQRIVRTFDEVEENQKKDLEAFERLRRDVGGLGRQLDRLARR